MSARHRRRKVRFTERVEALAFALAVVACSGLFSTLLLMTGPAQ